MSIFEKAMDKVSKPMSGVENVTSNLFHELSPMMGNAEGNNIMNSMRGATSALPEGFPSFDNWLSQKNAGQNPLSSVESLIGGGNNANGNPLSGIESLIGGGNNGGGLGGLLGSLGGSEGGAGGMLGSLSGLLGQGGGLSSISGILGEVAPLVSEIGPIISEVAPLALIAL